MNSFDPIPQNPQSQSTTYYYGGFPPYFDPEMYKRQQEQKAFERGITRRANAIGAGLLLVQAIGTVLIFLIPTLIDQFLPGASTSGSLFYEAIEYAIYAPLSIMLSFWIASKIARQPLEPLMPFGKHNVFLSVGCILFSFLGVAGGNLISGFVGQLFPAIEENMETAMGVDPTTPMELVIYILYVAAIPALVEEFAFRGVVLGLLRPYGDKFAIVTSAVCFALLHGNFIQIPFAFFVGLVLGYAVVRTGSMIPAIIIHFLNNALSGLLTYFDAALTELFGGWYSLCVYAVWIVLGLIGYLILRVGFRQKLTACYTPYTGCITAGRRTGAFYKGAALIVAIAVYLLTALLLAIPMPY